MDCNLPGSSVHGIHQRRILECANEANIRDTVSFTESGISPGGGRGNPFHYSCLENPHGQRNLVDYNPWGRKDTDMTERLTLSFSFTIQELQRKMRA